MAKNLREFYQEQDDVARNMGFGSDSRPYSGFSTGFGGGANGATAVFGGPSNPFGARTVNGGGQSGGGFIDYSKGGTNPNIVGDGWRVKPANVVNGVNMDIINDAIRNLPIPDLSGERPPTQTGGTDTPTETPSTGTPTVGGGSIPSGNGQVPSAPTGGSNNNPLDRILDIFRNPILSGGRTPPFNPNGGDMSQQPTDDGFFDWLFGGGEGGSASANNALSNIIDAGTNFYFEDKSADAIREGNKDALDFYRMVYGDQIDRLEPFRQAGLGGIPELVSQASNGPNFTTPTTTPTVGLPALAAGNRNTNVDPSLSYSTPVAGSVDVGGFNPYDPNDPRLKYLIDQGTNAIEGSAAAQGKLNSGGTLEALQEMGQQAAMGRANEIQALESEKDRLRLVADNQRFGQELGASGFDLGAQSTQFGQNFGVAQFLDNQNNRDLANASGIRSQLFGEGNTLFGQEMGLAQLGMDTDQQKYNQLFDLVRLGGNAAAGQGSGTASFGNTGANLLSANGNVSGAQAVGQGQNIGNALSRFFV